MKKWQRSSSLDLQSDRYYPYYTLYPVRAYHTESNSRVPGTGYSTVSYTYDINYISYSACMIHTVVLLYILLAMAKKENIFHDVLCMIE